MLVAKNFNREFLELWIYKHRLARSNVEEIMSQNQDASDSGLPVTPETNNFDDNMTEETKGNDLTVTQDQPKLNSIISSPPTDLRNRESISSSRSSSAERSAAGSLATSTSPAAVEDFCRCFEQAMVIARHAERAKSEARNALDRAEKARSFAEQAWDQAISAAEAAQSIARSGLVVAKLSLDACNPKSRPNQPATSLKSGFDLFASRKEPPMDFDRFQQALKYDDETVDDGIVPFDFDNEDVEMEFPCTTPNCETCHNRQLAKDWRFFKAHPEQAIPCVTELVEPTRQHHDESFRSLPKKREEPLSAQVADLVNPEDKIPKLSNVPKCFEKYSSPLSQFSSTSSKAPKPPNQRAGSPGKVIVPPPPPPPLLQTNHVTEHYFHANSQPIKTQRSSSDELAYLAIWPPFDLDGPGKHRIRRDTQMDDGAMSDDSTHSAPVFIGVRSRQSDSTEDRSASPPLRPRQIQRLSDMEPTDENIRGRLQQAYQASMARRSRSCSSEPGSDAARLRPCSPLVLPDVDSGTNVQILPNNVQVFQPPLAKSTTPPTSFHDNMAASAKAYLSD